MSAKNKVEDAIAASLEADELLELQLGVPVYTGLRTGKRPPAYVVAIADSESSVSPEGGVYFVECRIVSVVHLDDDGNVDESKRRIEKIMGWLGPECRLRSYADAGIAIKGVVVQGSESETRDRRQGEIIRIRVACLV